MLTRYWVDQCNLFVIGRQSVLLNRLWSQGCDFRTLSFLSKFISVLFKFFLALFLRSHFHHFRPKELRFPRPKCTRFFGGREATSQPMAAIFLFNRSRLRRWEASVWYDCICGHERVRCSDTITKGVCFKQVAHKRKGWHAAYDVSFLRRGLPFPGLLGLYRFGQRANPTKKRTPHQTRVNVKQ